MKALAALLLIFAAHAYVVTEDNRTPCLNGTRNAAECVR
jgi:hypothetical protein